MLSTGSIHDEDRNVDVMTLTPVQLQSMVLRLRSKLTAVESLVDVSTYRRSGSKGSSWASFNLSGSDIDNNDEAQDPKDGDKRFTIPDEDRVEQMEQVVDEKETRSTCVNECEEEEKKQ
jgi:hypothetical protein